MDDLISRAAALDAIFGCFNVMESEGIDMTVARTIVKAVLDGALAVDAAPVVHGQWIRYSEIFHDPEYTLVKCSVCGGESCCDADYCPDCGAKMDGEV